MACELKLGGILDGHDALTQVDLAGKGIEQGCLARARTARHGQILTQRDGTRKQLRIPRRQGTQSHQLSQRGDPVGKFSDRENRPVDCDRRDYRIYAIAARKASVHDGTALIDTTSQRRDDSVDNHTDLLIIRKHVVHRMELSRALIEGRGASVDHDLAHAIIIEQLLQRTKSHDIV